MQIDLLTDVDGPLFDWSSAFLRFASERLGRQITPTNPDPNYAHEWLGLGHDEAQPLIMEFQRSDELSRLPAFPDAVKVLPALAAQGYRITAISGCNTDKCIVDNRWVNLRAAFGDIFTDFIPLPYRVSKKDALARFKPGVWVEDAHYHAQAGHEVGHNSFLMHRGIQPIVDGAPYRHVTDWTCVEALLIDPTRNCC